MNRDDTIGARCGAILQEALRLLGTTPAAFVIFLVVMIGAATLVDVYSTGPAGNFAVNGASIFASFGLTMAIITTSVEGGRKGRRGAMTYVGISILSGLACAVGFLLLIVPGLILSARWSPVYGFALGDGHGVVDAMGESWEATRGHTVPIVLAMLVPYAFNICGVGLVLMTGENFVEWSWITATIINGFVYIGVAVGIAVGLAVFSLLARQNSDVAEVFE